MRRTIWIWVQLKQIIVIVSNAETSLHTLLRDLPFVFSVEKKDASVQSDPEDHPEEIMKPIPILRTTSTVHEVEEQEVDESEEDKELVGGLLVLYESWTFPIQSE